MRQPSGTSAGAIYLNRPQRIEELRAAAHRAAAKVPGLLRIVLFGSLASGIPTPRSDADLLVIVEHSEHVRPHDRVPELLGALAPLPCPVDVFVLTVAELAERQAAGDPLVREALAGGVELLAPSHHRD